MTFEEAKDRIRRILTYSHPIGSWELEDIMDALDITPCDISTCKVAKALWGNKGNIPDIDISRVKNATPLEAQPTDADCISREAVLLLQTEYAEKMSSTTFWKLRDDIRGLPPVKPKYTDEEIDKAQAVEQAYVDKMVELAVEEVKRPKGKWIKIQSGDEDFPESIVCSRCKGENSHIDFNEHGEPIGKIFVMSKYCPNCGAYMSGGGEE